MKELLIILSISFLTLVKIAMFGLVSYIIFYIYNYGLEQLLTSIWKGFA